jgi:hypothetical protein
VGFGHRVGGLVIFVTRAGDLPVREFFGVRLERKWINRR